jgi:hypothetical protein
MDTQGFQVPERLVDQPVTCEGGEPDELACTNAKVEMPAFGSAGMAGVQGAVVSNLEGLRRECVGQSLLQD